MTTPSERRRFTRVAFDTAATLAQGKTVFHTKILDLSINGALLETPANYAMRADLPADISIFLSEDAEIQMRVILVHSSSNYLGFKCTSIDAESASHLRKLVELNLGNDQAAERILDELMSAY